MTLAGFQDAQHRGPQFSTGSRRYAFAVLDALIGALVGGAFTIIGGFLAAWWQTARSDNIAQAIRRAQRREDALLALAAKAGEVYSAVASIRDAVVERGAVTAQYPAALAKLSELTQMWLWQSAGAIPDESVINAYWFFDHIVRDRLPGGEGALKYMDMNISGRFAEDGTGMEPFFVADLNAALAALRIFMQAIAKEVDGLLNPPKSRLRQRLRPAATALRADDAPDAAQLWGTSAQAGS